MSDDILVASIGRLEIGPGDMLVVRSLRRLTEAEAEMLRRQLLEALPPGAQALVLDPGIEMTVVSRRQEKAEEMRDMVVKIVLDSIENNRLGMGRVSGR